MLVAPVVEAGDGAVDKTYRSAAFVQLEECRSGFPLLRFQTVATAQPEGIGRSFLSRQACLLGPIHRLAVDEGGDAVDVDHRAEAVLLVPCTDQRGQLATGRASRDGKGGGIGSILSGMGYEPCCCLFQVLHSRGEERFGRETVLHREGDITVAGQTEGECLLHIGRPRVPPTAVDHHHCREDGFIVGAVDRERQLPFPGRLVWDGFHRFDTGRYLCRCDPDKGKPLHLLHV